MFFIFAIMFLVFSIIVSIFDVKKRKLEGFKMITAVSIYLYFGISMSLCCVFATINSLISTLIFLQLILVLCLILLKDKKEKLTLIDIIIVVIIGMFICFCHISNLEYSKLLYLALGIGIYLLPILLYFDRKKLIVRKIKHCTEEVDAKVIKVYKGRAQRHIVYVPKLEFELNNKTYKVMDSTEIYFRNKKLCEIGNTIKLFVHPNPKINSTNGQEDIYLPNSYKEYIHNFNTIIFYASTLLIFLLIVISLYF